MTIILRKLSLKKKNPPFLFVAFESFHSMKLIHIDCRKLAATRENFKSKLLSCMHKIETNLYAEKDLKVCFFSLYEFKKKKKGLKN